MCPETFSYAEDNWRRSSCSILLNFFIACADHNIPGGAIPYLWTSTGNRLPVILHGWPAKGFLQGRLLPRKSIPQLEIIMQKRYYSTTGSRKQFYIETKPLYWRPHNPTSSPVLHIYTLYITATSFFSGFSSVCLTAYTKLKATMLTKQRCSKES